MRLTHRRQRRRGRSSPGALDSALEDSAPEASLINLVDLMLVFAVGLMLALTVQIQQLSREVAAHRLDTPQRMKTTGQPQTGSGVRVGSAYRLASGDIVYVPEAAETPPR